MDIICILQENPDKRMSSKDFSERGLKPSTLKKALAKYRRSVDKKSTMMKGFRYGREIANSYLYWYEGGKSYE